MNRLTVAVIAVSLALIFGGLVYYGLRHSRGIPVEVEEEKRPELDVPFIDSDIDISRGVADEIWASVPGREIDMLYQLMILPWGKSLQSPIEVKALHNGRDIFFRLSWKDGTEDRDLEIDSYSDAAAVLFPLQDDVQPSSIMMGFIQGANIWQWKASQGREYWGKAGREDPDAYVDWYYPFEESELFPVSMDIPESGASDLVAIRVGTVTRKEVQLVNGRGEWDDGVWTVVLKRSLRGKDPSTDAFFERGGSKLCAFAVWNGSKGDRGGRKSISDWVTLNIN